MDYDAKIRRLAEILIVKHGNRAASVSRRRAKERLDHQDYEAAVVWVQVTEAAERLIGAPMRPASAVSTARH